MAVRQVCASILITVIWQAATLAQANPQPHVEPFISVEAGGPTAQVTGMAFSPDGRQLYIGGYDKVVRVYDRNEQGSYELDPTHLFRVPIGPGLIGSIFDLALSSDGQWLAVGGRGVVQSEAGFRNNGWIWPRAAMTSAMRQEQGVIYLWNTRTREVRQLRGHQGIVVALAFSAQPAARAGEGKPGVSAAPFLVSAAAEGDELAAGAVFAWDIERGTYRRYPESLPKPLTHPGLAAWTDATTQGQRVAISWWEDGKLRLWDVASNRMAQANIGLNNQSVAYLPDQDLVLASGFMSGKGALTAWRISGEDALETKLVRKHDFSAESNQQIVAPQTFTVFSSPTGATAAHAAVAFYVLDQQGRPPKHSFDVIFADLTAQNFGQDKSRVHLWDGVDLLPAVAVNTKDRRVAISGNTDKAVRIYDFDAFAKQQTAQLQVLQGAGLGVSKAIFVRHRADQRRGIALWSTSDREKDADLIFDIALRRLIDYHPNDWLTDVAANRGWSVAVSEKKVENQIRRV